tara:strand:- start:4886 stop:5929 length:1044 start_codon:yes stop_codon:yes gene_type:complete
LVNKTIAVLACANGLGHVRRVISIISFMLKNGFEGKIEAFIPINHLSYFENWEDCNYFINNDRVSIKDFTYPQKNKIKTNHLFGKEWEKIELPDLSGYDIVWSDNILQVLEQRNDAIISGSFFWYEVFEKNMVGNGLENFVKSQKRLLYSIKPRMIGNEYFSTKEVKLNTEFYPVGLYRYSTLYREKNNKGILLSCGLGGEEEALTKKAIKQIIDENIKPPDLLYVEPRLLPKRFPDWVKEADFSDEMFHYCAAVCIRPGMGTLSDSLISRNRVFAFSKKNSYEMIHNSNVIERLLIGQKSKDAFHAYKDAIEYLKDQEQVSQQIYRTSHLRMDGVFATADIIANAN